MPLSRLAQTSWGIRKSFFFRFAAVLFFARSLPRNERAFFVKMIPSDSWAALEPGELAPRVRAGS